MKARFVITLLAVLLVLAGCNGSRKYFKAAERLEKQGLVQDAAQYYLEALQRKTTNVDARIKLKEVGQKHVSNLSSEFFRDFNTQQIEASLQTFERLKDFHERCAALNVTLDYPKTYEEDYQTCVDQFLNTNYNRAYLLVNQKKFPEALTYIKKIQKYNASYKNTVQLETIAVCEPLYQLAVNSLESRNYASALQLLSQINSKSSNYKDAQDLLELATAQQRKSFILFEPQSANAIIDKQIQSYLYDNFNQVALKSFNNISILNNTPFQNTSQNTNLNTSTNVDLVQAIRKATGADYFYVFDVSNGREYSPSVNKVSGRAYEEVITRINDTTTKTEYKPIDYYVVKGSRSFTYNYSYKLINAYNNQIIASQTQAMSSSDAIEYNEFARRYAGKINSIFPYNPEQLAPAARYNPRNFRSGFTARNTLKSMEELKADAFNKNINVFKNAAALMK